MPGEPPEHREDTVGVYLGGMSNTVLMIWPPNERSFFALEEEEGMGFAAPLFFHAKIHGGLLSAEVLEGSAAIDWIGKPFDLGFVYDAKRDRIRLHTQTGPSEPDASRAGPCFHVFMRHESNVKPRSTKSQ